MHSTATIEEAFALAEGGTTQMEIARALRIGQTTVSRWLRSGKAAVLESPMRERRASARRGAACPARCPTRIHAPGAPYAHLLGQYPGDGTIVHTGKGVYRLFITCCSDYPGILDETRAAIGAVLPANRVSQRAKPGCFDVMCYSKHLRCLFPQHGPGKKHLRPIVLTPWQEDIVLDTHPGRSSEGSSTATAAG